MAISRIAIMSRLSVKRTLFEDLVVTRAKMRLAGVGMEYTCDL
jgi:hypothetical protein